MSVRVRVRVSVRVGVRVRVSVRVPTIMTAAWILLPRHRAYGPSQRHPTNRGEGEGWGGEEDARVRVWLKRSVKVV